MVQQFLNSRGIADEHVQLFPVNRRTVEERDEQRNFTGRVLRYHYDQGFLIEHSDVQLIRQLSLDLAGLVAEAAGARLGPIRDARMGVLQVTPRHSTQVSSYGINDNSSIEKQITAVVHASFAIR